MSMASLLSMALLSACMMSAAAFAPSPSLVATLRSRTIESPMVFAAANKNGYDDDEEEAQGGVFGAIGNFFAELDAFVDDATSRRLGAGSAFYGKRKSSFYGETDKNKKKVRDTPDPTEDYQGPAKAGYFQWMMDDEGQMRPVTRMKSTNIERNPKFWDRAFKEDE